MALELPSVFRFGLAARQAHNPRLSAALVFSFVLFFLIGGAVDYLYLDALSSTDFPLATVAEEQSDETVKQSLAGAAKLILGTLVRTILCL